MPASILQGIFEIILQAILEVVCYYVGRIFILVVSAGRLECDRFLKESPRRKRHWSGVYHRRGLQIYLTAEATACVGIFVIALAVLAVIFL